jgi:pyridoxamine 5'-phosphate oxidase
VAEAPGTRDSLSKRDLDPDPIAQFRVWLDDARAEGISLPEAVALATVDGRGRPSVRYVLLRGVDRRGFVFYTNYESRKGRELNANPSAGMAFYWPELHRQVCVTGTVERTSREESEAYFRSRPREARVGAWASRQSEVVSSREELDARYREIDARYPGDAVPLPANWGGFRLAPETVEFWKGREHRLHDRFRYTMQTDGTWVIERLFP